MVLPPQELVVRAVVKARWILSFMGAVPPGTRALLLCFPP